MDQVTRNELKAFQDSWAKHKYWVMAHSQQAYNYIRLMAKENQWTSCKQAEYEAILFELEALVPTDKSLRVAYEHIWGYFKKEASEREKERYQSLIHLVPMDRNALDVFLHSLAKKYNKSYLLDMKWPIEK